MYEILFILNKNNINICLQSIRRKKSIGPFLKLKDATILDDSIINSQKRICSFLMRYSYPLSFPISIDSSSFIFKNILNEQDLKFYIKKYPSGSIKKLKVYSDLVNNNKLIEYTYKPKVDYINIYIPFRKWYKI